MPLKFTVLPNDKFTWSVTAYGQLRSSIKTPDAPSLDIQLVAQETGEQRIVQIGLFDALEIPIGSYWRGQKRVRYPDQNQVVIKTFKLEITELNESSFIKAYSKDEEAEELAWNRALERAQKQKVAAPSSRPNRYVIPPQILKVNKRLAGTNYLDVTAVNGTQVLIPSLTIFLRMYGASKRFKEYFLNYKLQFALGKMIFPVDLNKLENRPDPSDYVIGLSKEMYDDDSPFIHQLLEADYFKGVHRFIRHQLNTQLKHGVYLKVPMWFKGTMRLQVRGVPYTTECGKARFLVYDILGLSYPSFPTFFLDRSNTTYTNDDDINDEGDDKPPGWNGPYGYPHDGKEDERDSQYPPGHNAGMVSYSAPPISILGAKPEITKAIRKSKVTGGRPDKEHYGVGYESTSTSEAFSDNDDIAKAREQQEPQKDDDSKKASANGKRLTKDVIGLLEKALESLHGIGALCDFQFIGGTEGDYYLTKSFQALEFSGEVSDVWSYHGKDPNDRRLLVVAKLTLNGGEEVFVCEIQPRINRKGNSDGNLKGCVFLGLPTGFGSEELDTLIASLVLSKGVWSKVPLSNTGPRYPYRHVGSPTEAMMARSITAAIEKLPGMQPELKTGKQKRKKGASKAET
ncbi:hypothetical protein [Aliidiomarina sanyensis]|uniref:TnsE C-terminal domain-containing protein n=1 Tax=Aliidiomarina sanyensis TaxID=1249555 RepID=A0A432WPG5_9GAMM|nr:hypothetical protein [Aliidiomarina sanyensis]RUO35700.1 hypothetical protein CWE11_02775 [Aliidiomarina sanyensis]